MIEFSGLSIEELIQPEGFDCECGEHHLTKLRYVKIGSGVTENLPQVLENLHAHRPFVVCDQNTTKVAWPKVKAVLEGSNIPYTHFVFSLMQVEPDEVAIGDLALSFDPRCDIILGVGSGVINDCCKILAKISGKPLIIFATAPSMDGYASDSASMIKNRVKVSLQTPCPAVVIADTDVLVKAPMRMLHAGLGDMLAKYTALCEWQIAHLVIKEYYCPNVANLVRCSLKKCVDNAKKLVLRDPRAVEAVLEGLILSGIAMSFAKCSRPASGLDHYFSHMWEMMALDRNEPADLHGIQVGVGTYLTIKVMERLIQAEPDWDLAQRHALEFNKHVWEKEIKVIFGKAADTVIQGETEKYHKNDKNKLFERIESIRFHWAEIVHIVKNELPDSENLLSLMKSLQMPVVPQDLGLKTQDVRQALIGSRDIRDKYLVSSLLWDLGKLHEYADILAS